jgi:hypothetical protein
MPVRPDSRFARLPVHRVLAPDGSTREVIGLRLERAGVGRVATRHLVMQGEAVDLIARDYLGSEGLWWRLLDANPLRYPLDLEPGDVLAVPPALEATRVTRARSF